MKSHKIEVTVSPTGIQVDPDTLRMTADDEVEWHGTTAKKFTIAFEGAGPFAARELRHAEATSRQRPQNKGRFKYSIISEEDPSVQLDPVIVVDEPPSTEL